MKPVTQEFIDSIKEGFGTEAELIQNIKESLLSEDQKLFLIANDLSVYDVLNGRFPSGLSGIREMLSEWNCIMGFDAFETDF